MTSFLTTLTLPNKQYFSVKVLVGLRGQLFNSYTTYKFKMKLLYNDEEFFYTKTELLSFKIILSLGILDMVRS